MTEEEMLKFAAKAVGAEWVNFPDIPGPGAWTIKNPRGEWVLWSPLTNDGDALRLAVKLQITDLALAVGEYVVREKYREGDSIETITRRAITRAAAEIGKAMP